MRKSTTATLIMQNIGLLAAAYIPPSLAKRAAGELQPTHNPALAAQREHNKWRRIVRDAAKQRLLQLQHADHETRRAIGRESENFQINQPDDAPREAV